jgi:hypothetical protein
VAVDVTIVSIESSENIEKVMGVAYVMTFAILSVVREYSRTEGLFG